MAISHKALRDELRVKYLDRIVEFFRANGEDVLRTGSNELAFPTVDSADNDEFIVITVKVPTGTRDGDPYDGYAMAEEYALKTADKAAKAKEQAVKKAAKIAKDEAVRKAKAEAKAKAKEERG